MQSSPRPLSYALIFTAGAGQLPIAACLAIWIGRPATGTSAAQFAASPANQGA
jgi:hypothetical protein